MSPHYAFVARRAGHQCEYCRAPEAIFNSPFEVEHVVPTSRGGVDDPSNLALACRSCNVHKAAHLTGEDDATRSTAALFHPRRDEWEEHFRADRETGAIGGLTPVGRATVARLQMNTTAQLLARQLWTRLGLFPG
jgi:hypothetical protein